MVTSNDFDDGADRCPPLNVKKFWKGCMSAPSFDDEIDPGLEFVTDVDIDSSSEWFCEICRPESVTPTMTQFRMSPPAVQSSYHVANDDEEHQQDVPREGSAVQRLRLQDSGVGRL